MKITLAVLFCAGLALAQTQPAAKPEPKTEAKAAGPKVVPAEVTSEYFLQVAKEAQAKLAQRELEGWMVSFCGGTAPVAKRVGEKTIYECPQK